MEPPKGPDVRLAEIVAALSLATDLGMGRPMEVALRSCLLAVRLGEALGLTEQDLRDVSYVALLRSAGCTAEASITAAVCDDEIAARTWLAMLDSGRPREMLAALVRHVGAGTGPATTRACREPCCRPPPACWRPPTSTMPCASPGRARRVAGPRLHRPHAAAGASAHP